MANWFCSVFNVVCRKRVSSPRCRSELIDSAWVVIVPGQKYIKKSISYILNVRVCVVSLSQTCSRDLLNVCMCCLVISDQ